MLLAKSTKNWLQQVGRLLSQDGKYSGRCGKKEVRKAVLGYPAEEDFNNENIYLIGCIPDFPIDRTWGCRNCSAGFWKDTPRNKAALGGLVPHKWPKEEEVKEEDYKYEPVTEIPF